MAATQRIKLLKCDCEGGEYEFLMCSESKILATIDYLALEVHPTNFYSPNELIEFLKQNNWDVVALPGGMGSASLGAVDVFAANTRKLIMP